MAYSPPLAYLISFRTYGTWLHGDERGSVDRKHNTYGAPLLPPNERLERSDARAALHASVILSTDARALVERTIRAVCAHRRWGLSAVNVRTNHVHTVVSGGAAPDKMLDDLKAWGTRRLRESGFVGADEDPWSRGGSKRHLFTPQQVDDAVDYVMNRQD